MMKTRKNFLKKLTAGILGFVMTLGVGAAGYSASASETRAADETVSSNDTISTTALTSSTINDGDKVVWGTSTSDCVYTITSDWGKTTSTKTSMLKFTVVTGTNGFYLKNGSNYVYSSAAKKMAWNTTSKTLFTLNSNNCVYNSTTGLYTKNGTNGIRPYTGNTYTPAYLYKVTSAATEYTITFNSNGGSGEMSSASASTLDSAPACSFTAPSSNLECDYWSRTSVGSAIS